ncbi:MAG TPA: hypothetical protein VGK32_02540 [Vicinamibacterales bacterium]|jgi:hypothetical protein
MSSRILRTALVLLAVAGLGSAGFFVFQTEQRLAASRESIRQFDREASRVLIVAGELRGAHAAVLAAGQDPAFWSSKVGSLRLDTDAALKKIERPGLAPETALELKNARDALAAFEKTDDRVRELLSSNQPLTASMLVFGEASQHVTAALDALAGARTAQVAESDRTMVRLREQQVYALLGAAGLTLAVLLLLLPRAPMPAAADDNPSSTTGLGLSLNSASPQDVDALGRSGFDLDFTQPAVAPPTPDVVPEPQRESEEQLTAGLQSESRLRLNTDAQLDLPGAARLCSDMARIKDAGELPQLLSRAADLLDASGIVVWLGGVSGDQLRPAFSHGYGAHTLAKMQALPRLGENAVSAAYRDSRLEVVPAGSRRSGAIVTPITTAAGCVGAMAAEIRHGGEANASVQAIATIIAAQLATLVLEER